MSNLLQKGRDVISTSLITKALDFISSVANGFFSFNNRFFQAFLLLPFALSFVLLMVDFFRHVSIISYEKRPDDYYFLFHRKYRNADYYNKSNPKTFKGNDYYKKFNGKNSLNPKKYNFTSKQSAKKVTYGKPVYQMKNHRSNPKLDIEYEDNNA